MFPKPTKSGGRTNLQLVESYRNEAGQPRQRTVVSLGRLVDHRTLVKAQRRLGDLAVYAPKLRDSHLGEMTWSLVPSRKDLVLRLSLIPTRQGWLFDPLAPGSARAASLEAEVLQVFEELSAARVRVARLAYALEPGGGSDAHSRAAKDPLAAVLVRQSRRQWHISRGSDVVQVEFPDVQAFDVDSQLHRSSRHIGDHRHGLHRARRHLRHLLHQSEDTIDGPVQQVRSELGTMTSIGSRIGLKVRLCRCRLTRQVVGGTLDAPSELNWTARAAITADLPPGRAIA